MEEFSSTENEPLIVSGVSDVPYNSYLCHPRRVQRDLKSLEVVAVFVVAFDTSKGNVLEWCKPTFMKEQLNGLEFKAMPSGAHTLDSDYVYFYEADLYGLACYRKLVVNSDIERGARMKSVGVLCQSYESLEAHRERLEGVVRSVLNSPGDYTALDEYYSQWCGNTVQRSSSLQPPSQLLEFDGSHYEDVMKAFGPKLFTIWKAMLLQKRILIYSQPPAWTICQQVYCSTLMMSDASRLRTNMCTPFFYVNIADCDILSRQMSYIACTTEKVFEMKTDIYDVYVDDTELRITNSRLKSILAPTSGDRALLTRLWAAIRQPIDIDGRQPLTVEDRFYSFFSHLNTLISDKVHEFEVTEQPTLRRRDIESMGLDSSDVGFICELLESMNLEMSKECSLCQCW